jgi:hypothetical protein
VTTHRLMTSIGSGRTVEQPEQVVFVPLGQMRARRPVVLVAKAMIRHPSVNAPRWWCAPTPMKPGSRLERGRRLDIISQCGG